MTSQMRSSTAGSKAGSSARRYKRTSTVQGMRGSYSKNTFTAGSYAKTAWSKCPSGGRSTLKRPAYGASSDGGGGNNLPSVLHAGRCSTGGGCRLDGSRERYRHFDVPAGSRGMYGMPPVTMRSSVGFTCTYTSLAFTSDACVKV